MQQSFQPIPSLFINNSLKTQLTPKYTNNTNKILIYKRSVSTSPTRNSILSFDSQFEGGNLQYVFSDNLSTYDLYMQPDTNTLGHYQWFNFKVKNRGRKKVRFRICNFTKKNMMYSKGLAPFYKSSKENKQFYEQISTNCTF